MEDILEQLRNDPVLLLQVIEEIDKDGNHKLSKQELATWMANHAKELNIQGRNLYDDVNAMGAEALKGVEPFNFDDVKNPPGSAEAVNQEKMKARVAAEESRNILNSRIAGIIIEIKDAIEANQPSRADQVRNAPHKKTKAEREEDEDDGPDGINKMVVGKNTRAAMEEMKKKDPSQGGDDEEQKAKPAMKLSPQQQKLADEARAVLSQYNLKDVGTPPVEDLVKLILTTQGAPSKDGKPR